MRRVFVLAPVLLAGCSTAPAAPPAIPVHGETAGHTCNTSRTAQFIGQIRSDELGAEITRATNATVLRWAPPGVMLTTDYRSDRVTVRLDPSSRITQVKCG
jgi:hypothetical protein